MRVICDGHEYRVTKSEERLVAINNYGREVASAVEGEAKDCWIFSAKEPRSGALRYTGMSPRFSVEEQLVRWYVAISS